MKVKEFVEIFKAQKFIDTKINPTAVEDFIKENITVKPYIPFVEKQAIVQIVLTTCSRIEDGVIAIDSVQKYILFTISLLATYTDLETDEDIEAYDLLCSITVGDGTLLDSIIKLFEKEYGRCLNILNMMTADLLAENNIEKQVGKFLTGILAKVDELSDGLKANINNIPETLSQLDIDKLVKLLEK